MVRTAKYEYYDFLPKFLWEEFNPATKIANVIPSITNTFGIPLMLLPLFFVVCVDAIFMIEVGDLIVINNREAVPCDVLIMGVDEAIPESPAGVAYVETKSLDGETNLKIRQVVKGVLGKLVKPEDCASLAGRVIMEHPDKLIGNFKGKLILYKRRRRRPSSATANNSDHQGGRRKSGGGGGGEASDPEDVVSAELGAAGAVEPSRDAVVGVGSEKGDAAAAGEDETSEPISPDMLLLRGCVLRNTRWVLGLVLNTGPDTKIMMSMSKAPSKASHLSSRINQEIKRVAAVMGTVCLVGAFLTTIWNAQYQDSKPYLQFNTSSDSLVGMFFTQFLYNALLLNSFIPISLYVSMNFDLDMYHAESDTPARVRTMNLNEDLGQVSHIFSDKTGTLTCNIMDFRKFSVGGVSYGLGITEIGRAAMVVEGEKVPEDVLRAEELATNHSAPHVNFYDPSVYKDLHGEGAGGQEQACKLKDFFTALALCHTVIPERFEDTDEVILSASSPDDEALVLGAKYFGFEFINRIDSNAILHTWDVTAPPSSSSPPIPSNKSKAGATSETADANTTVVGIGAGPRVTAPGGEGVGGAGSDEVDLNLSEGGGGVGGVGRAEGAKSAGEGKPKVNRVSYEVLHVLGFTSDRKRMSVILRTEEGTIKIICKGADTTMLPRLRSAFPEEKQAIEETVKHMDNYAREGLRTLVVGQAELDPVAFQKWEQTFEEASNDLVEIDKRNMGEPNRIEDCMELIETNLEIIGASAIEDKLQAGVAGAVSDLMAAGIKIWVLTGDKEETAINIAVACQLLWTEAKMHRTVINLKGTGESETDEIRQALEDFLSKSIEERNLFEEDVTGKVAPPLPRGLVIDGPALLEAMRTPASQGALLRAAQTCHSVIGCRLSPDQKRALVALVRENVPGARTLSIGDGANDVPMIQRAHIGVGISGQEGMQAVNASDYAIAQFAYLRKLLLVHGRWNYRRSSRVVCYLFYKSVMFACPLFFYAGTNGFSGTLFYDYVTCNMYAIVYTALPILLYGTYDRDISAETCLRYPQLYAYGIKDRCMRPTIFWSWMLQALIESAFLTFAPIILLSGDVNGMGVVTSTYDYGTMTYALVVIQVTLKMFWVQYRWTRIHALVLIFSVCSFFVSAVLVNAWIPINWDYHGVVYSLFQSQPYWAVMIWCLVVVAGRDWASKFHHRWWRPRLHHLMLESDKRLMDEDSMEDQQDSAMKGVGKAGADGSLGDGPEGRMTPPMSAQPNQAGADNAHDKSPTYGEYVVGSGGGKPGEEPLSPAAAYVGMFHRHLHPRSKTNGQEQERGQQQQQKQQQQRQHQPILSSNPNFSGPTAPAPVDHTHHRGRGGRSVAGSFLDGSDISIRGLLESTFSPAVVHGRAQPLSPIPMNALAETLREARDYRNINNNGGSGTGTHIFPTMKPFSTSMPSPGECGKHGRLKSSSNVEARPFGRLAQTLGAFDGAWHRRRSNAEAGSLREANHGGHETATGGGGGDDDEEDWDPFAPGVAEAGPAADGAKAAAATETSNGREAPNRPAVVRTTSRRLLGGRELSGRDPREAAKLMRKEAFFVEMNENEKQRRPERRNSYRLSLGRRNSDRGVSAPRQSPPSAVLHPTTTDAPGAAATATAASRRHSSVSEKSSGANGNARLSATSGGFAFSCDVKAQRAEIAMILGRRASPMPRTASFLNRNKSAMSITETAAWEVRAGIEDGKRGGGGGEATGEERSSMDQEIPPLQRRSSGLVAGLARRVSIRGPDAPGDVQEEEDEDGDGDEDEDEDAKQDAKQEDEQRPWGQ
eukprot:g10792.t1